jgi:hypothetical protein
LAQQAQTQINPQLQSRGLQLVQESQNPDLIVVANGGMKTQTSYNAWGSTGGLRWGGGMGTVTPEQSVIGTLIVDLYDPKAKELAWRGTAQDTLDQRNSQKNLEKVDKAVVKMFKKYPYPAKSKSAPQAIPCPDENLEVGATLVFGLGSVHKRN